MDQLRILDYVRPRKRRLHPIWTIFFAVVAAWSAIGFVLLVLLLIVGGSDFGFGESGIPLGIFAAYLMWWIWRFLVPVLQENDRRDSMHGKV